MKRKHIGLLCFGLCVVAALWLAWFWTPAPMIPNPERAEVISVRYLPHQDGELRWEKHSPQENEFAIDEVLEQQILEALSNCEFRRRLRGTTTDTSVYDEVLWLMVRPVKGKSDLMYITLGLDDFAQKNLSWPERTILNGEEVTEALLEILDLK